MILIWSFCFVMSLAWCLVQCWNLTPRSLPSHTSKAQQVNQHSWCIVPNRSRSKPSVGLAIPCCHWRPLKSQLLAQVRAIAYALQVPGSTLPGHLYDAYCPWFFSLSFGLCDETWWNMMKHDETSWSPGSEHLTTFRIISCFFSFIAKSTITGDWDAAEGTMVVTVKCGEMAGDIPCAAPLRQQEGGGKDIKMK